MGRIPLPGEIEQRFRQLVDQALDATPPGPQPEECHQPTDVPPQAELAAELLERLVRGLRIAHPIVAEALATTLVALGREIAPPPAPRGWWRRATRWLRGGQQ
jgi:hypothetical protein